jgi:hypothetical protein
MKRRELFVFSGQSNMMGACVYLRCNADERAPVRGVQGAFWRTKISENS